MDAGKLTLRVFAVLFGLRALTDVFKPLGAGSGLVFFGKLVTGVPNVILAPLVGIYMLVYAYGLWHLRRFALPMAIAYAVYASINLVVFPILQSIPGGHGAGAYAGFVAIGAGVCWGAVWLLRRRVATLT